MLHGHGHHHDHGAHGKRSLIDDILNGQDDSDDNETSDEMENVDNSNNGYNVEERAVSIVYVTMPATFDGPIGGYSTEGVSSTEKTAESKHTSTAASVGVGAPVQQTRTQTTATQTTEETTKSAEASTTVPTVISASTATATATGDEITAITSAGSKSSTTQTTFQTAVATTAAAASSSLTSVASVAAAAASSASSASATAKASASHGMSGGAKAGLAIGIIVGIGMIASLVLFWLHKKKQQQKMMLTEDNEKSYGAPDLNEKAMPPLPPPSMVQSTTPSKPPQLNVRPITQFAPDLSAVGSSTGSAAPSGVTTAATATAAGAVAIGAVAAGAVSRNLTGNASSPPTPPKSGGSPQNPFSDPVNPFGSHAELPPSPPASATTSDVPETKNPDTPIRDSGVLPEHSVIGAAAAGAAIGIAVGEVVESTSKEQNDQPANGHSFETRPASPAPTGPLPPSPASVNTGVAVSSPGIGVAGGPPSNVHRVQMDFNPTMEDELELRAGQLVRLLHEYDDGWALCIRLDRSQQGVAPRTCLSARPVKPRSRPSGSASPRGPQMMGPNGRPMSPAAGPGRSPQTPRFYPQDGRPMSPARPGYAGPPRPPPQGRPMSPAQFPVPRSLSPGPGFRPPPQRSMSPGPYGPPGLQKPPAPISQRRRSNSASGVIGNNARFNPPPLGSPLAGPVAPRPPMSDQPTNRGPPQGLIERKPVPGQAI